MRTIVEGETKFSKIGVFNSETVSKGDVKARDLQHLFLAMTKEACNPFPAKANCFLDSECDQSRDVHQSSFPQKVLQIGCSACHAAHTSFRDCMFLDPG